jgi:hypothetical protein
MHLVILHVTTSVSKYLLPVSSYELTDVKYYEIEVAFGKNLYVVCYFSPCVALGKELFCRVPVFFHSMKR